jgi:pimeloyl-ACP methyl ester carboxylesterase
MLFYTGNEGDITLFFNNTEFVTETLAKEFHGLVVFAEHRYYGETLPFGSNSFSKENVGWLTSEQALADYAELIPYLQSKYNMQGCPVIAAGGSYGGMLTAWMRIKYPHIIDAGLAASAPILQFETTGVPEEAFSIITTQDFADASPACPDGFRQAFAALQNSTDLNALTRQFKLCDPLKTVDDLIAWVVNGLQYMAMADYPYPANFLEPMPAWPINLSCKNMDTPGPILNRLFNAMTVYYNYTGSAKCFDVFQYSTGALDDAAWDYQACTEMVFPISSNNVDDMFPVAKYDINALTKYCTAKWGVVPRPLWVPTWYGGINITASSNIIFSNGELDPWRGGGVQRTLNPTLIAIIIEKGAHHLDLRGPDPQDPPSVVYARQTEIALLRKWLNI